LGTISAVRDAVQLAHQNKALCFVDAVHYAAHRLIDVQAFDCDFLVCSPYKFYGPHTGVLYARAGLMAKLDVPKLDPASNEIPERFEIGTQNHEGIVGAGAAVDFLASLGMGATRREQLAHAMTALRAEGDKLLARLWSGLSRIKGVRLYGPPPNRPRTPTVSFIVQGIPSVQVAQHLAQRGIFVSNGNFYASGVVTRLGHNRDGLVRAGCACYTTETEVDRLLTAIGDIADHPDLPSPAQIKK
jgi:selenocysteine lyase/cysteine desulfurase